MFRKWLHENKIEDVDFSGVIFEKAFNRAFWEPKFKKEYVEDAEQYLGFEWPLMRATDYMAFHTEGNRVKQEIPHFKKRTVLISLLIGEIMEHKGRFIPDIVDGVFSICEESFWGLSAHQPLYKIKPLMIPDVQDRYIDLFAAETGALIAGIRYILRDELYDFCPDIVERMEYELDERIIKPYLKHTDFWWMGYVRKVNNWNPWILSNILTVFLLTEHSQLLLHKGIEKMLYEINRIYESYCDDGGCDEGVSPYWSVSGGTIFEFCEQLYRATNGKINFFSDEKIKKIGDHPYKAYIGNNYFVNFADGECRGSVIWKSILYGYGKRTNNENLAALAKESFTATNNSLAMMRKTYFKRMLFNVIYDKEMSCQHDLKLCEEAFLPDLENAFAREGKWYYAAKGGNNAENHNHNDVGSFIAYYDCQPVLVDPGCGVYTKQTFSPTERYNIWTMQSGWHNTPVVNGQQQVNGKQYGADSFSFENKKCTISFSDAYEEESHLRKLIRTISISDSEIEIQDAFSFCSQNNTIAEHFVTPLPVEIKGKGVVIGDEFWLTSDGDVEICVDQQPFFGDEKLTNSWNTDSMNRIVFKTTADDEKNIKIYLRRLS